VRKSSRKEKKFGRISKIRVTERIREEKGAWFKLN
jgi:hypothetical protein